MARARRRLCFHVALLGIAATAWTACSPLTITTERSISRPAPQARLNARRSGAAAVAPRVLDFALVDDDSFLWMLSDHREWYRAETDYVRDPHGTLTAVQFHVRRAEVSSSTLRVLGQSVPAVLPDALPASALLGRERAAPAHEAAIFALPAGYLLLSTIGLFAVCDGVWSTEAVFADNSALATALAARMQSDSIVSAVALSAAGDDLVCGISSSERVRCYRLGSREQISVRPDAVPRDIDSRAGVANYRGDISCVRSVRHKRAALLLGRALVRCRA